MNIDTAIAAYCKLLDDAYEDCFKHAASPMAEHIEVRHEVDSGGKVYARIVRREYRKDDGQVNTSSAVAFVKLADGTIWKPAGYKGPAKNFARGNVYSVGQRVAWSL